MREYAPDQTVFMFTISAAERQGHRGGQAGVFPDGQEALPKPACRRDAALLACGCQGGVVLRDGCAAREVWCCAMVVLPGRCGAVGACLSGRGLSKGTAPDAGTVRGCPVPGGGRCLSFTTGHCMLALPAAVGRPGCASTGYASSGQVCPAVRGVSLSAVRVGTQHADGAHDEGAGHLGIDGNPLGGELVQRGQVVLGALDAIAAVAVFHAFAA